MKKLKKDRRGVIEPINFAICIMILIVALGFFLDILRIGQQMQAVSRLNTEFARIVAAQGGISNSVPANYPGGDDNYVTLGEFRRTVDNVARSSGITGGINIERNPGDRIEFRHEFTTGLSFQYRWNMLDAMIPGRLPPGTYHSGRAGVSEFKHNYDVWDGE